MLEQFGQNDKNEYGIDKSDLQRTKIAEYHKEERKQLVQKAENLMLPVIECGNKMCLIITALNALAHWTPI